LRFSDHGVSTIIGNGNGHDIGKEASRLNTPSGIVFDEKRQLLFVSQYGGILIVDMHEAHPVDHAYCTWSHPSVELGTLGGICLSHIDEALALFVTDIVQHHLLCILWSPESPMARAHLTQPSDTSLGVPCNRIIMDSAVSLPSLSQPLSLPSFSLACHRKRSRSDDIHVTTQSNTIAASFERKIELMKNDCNTQRSTPVPSMMTLTPVTASLTSSVGTITRTDIEAIPRQSQQQESLSQLLSQNSSQLENDAKGVIECSKHPIALTTRTPTPTPTASVSLPTPIGLLHSCNAAAAPATPLSQPQTSQHDESQSSAWETSQSSSDTSDCSDDSSGDDDDDDDDNEKDKQKGESKDDSTDESSQQPQPSLTQPSTKRQRRHHIGVGSSSLSSPSSSRSMPPPPPRLFPRKKQIPPLSQSQSSSVVPSVAPPTISQASSSSQLSSQSATSLSPLKQLTNENCNKFHLTGELGYDDLLLDGLYCIRMCRTTSLIPLPSLLHTFISNMNDQCWHACIISTKE
jgi:hypothetical protein